MLFETLAYQPSSKEQNFDKIILYMDLDAFFAACEIREQPSLADKPVIVGGDPVTKKGVVSTCNYIAREFGIHSGMPVSKAVQLCPEVHIVRPSFRLYELVSNNIMAIVKQYSPNVKILSIDEAYLDLTGIARDYQDAELIAYEIKDEIYASESITCSIGIAPTRILAKIASGYNKPNGLTIIQPFEIKQFLESLDLTVIPGIGKKTVKKFNDKGIYTCGDLAKKPYRAVFENFGEYGLKIWKLVNGLNTETTHKARTHSRKSFSDEHTFFNNLRNWEEIVYWITDSANTIVKKAREKGYLFKTITIKIRFRNFDTYTRSHTLSTYTNSKQVVINTANSLLKAFPRKIKPSEIRLIGVKISNLRKIDRKQKPLSFFFDSSS